MNNKNPRRSLNSARKWRRVWDSNPRAVARKLISSQPRYDHFDNSPYKIVRLSLDFESAPL